jgi:hypothetical protein
MTAVPPSIQAMTDAELAAYPVPLRAYGEHSTEERAVIVERLRRSEKAEERALAARGFPKGGRVRIAESYRRHITNGHWAGREGAVVRPAMGGDYAYVQLDPRPRERTVKVEMIAVADLEPAPVAPTEDCPMLGHNGGPPLEDDTPAVAIRVKPPSTVSMREIARSLADAADVRAVPFAGGTFGIMHYGRGMSLATLAYVSGAPTAAAALDAFRARIAACRVDDQLDRVTTVIGPRHQGSYGVAIVIDGETRSAALPFAGHRGYAGSKRAAEEAARHDRRAAAAALIAYEAEHGPWLAKLEAEAAASAPPAEEIAHTTAARRIRVAMTEPWNGRGMPTPSALSRYLDLEDEAAAQAQTAALGIPAVRVLVLPCSATKRRDAGPLWQSYRAAVAEIGAAPTTMVLSAEFGVIGAADPIPDYDRILDHPRAVELAADPVQIDRLAVALDGATEVYVTGGALYRATVTAMVGELRRVRRVAPTLTLIAPDGLGIGEQRAALRAWLIRSAPAEQDRQAQATAPFAPGQRVEAQRRGPTGIGWQPCQIIDATPYGARVRFADGAELPRTLDSIRAVGAHQEAA